MKNDVEVCDGVVVNDEVEMIPIRQNCDGCSNVTRFCLVLKPVKHSHNGFW